MLFLCMSYYINEIAVFFKCDKIVAVCDFYFSVTNESSAWDVFRHWPVGLSGGRGILAELSLCYSTVYYYNGALRPVLTGRSTVSGFDLAGFSSASEHLCFSRSSWCCMNTIFCLHPFVFFCLHPSLYLLVSWAWWDWPLTWLTNHRPSVLWHCWSVMWPVKSSPKWPIMCRVVYLFSELSLVGLAVVTGF